MSNLPPPDPGQEAADTKTTAVISDTVTGLNLRKKDNFLQLKAIGICIPLGMLIGVLVPNYRLEGLLFGFFGGLFVGLFGSGIYLMIYRAVQHARGRSD